MPSRKVSMRASMANQTSILGIMGGLAKGRTSGASGNRATNKLVIPRGAAKGLAYMQLHGILSRNPLGSGGVGKVVKSKPCNCKGSKHNIKENIEENVEEEEELGAGPVCPHGQCRAWNGTTSSKGCFTDKSNKYCCDMSGWDGSGCTDISAVCGVVDTSLCGNAVDVCKAKYRCDGGTSGGVCMYDDNSDTLSTMAECASGCKALMYSCNKTTGKCTKDPKGTQTQSQCEGSCAQTLYSCSPTGTCEEDFFNGTYTKLSTCNAACASSYTCNGAYECVAGSGKLTKAVCTSTCVRPAPPATWSCNDTTKACENKPGVGKKTWEDCFDMCTPAFTCTDPTTNTCTLDEGVGTLTKASCTATCKPTMYSCNGTTGGCAVDAKGTFTTMAACNTACALYTCDSTTNTCTAGSGTLSKTSCATTCCKNKNETCTGEKDKNCCPNLLCRQVMGEEVFVCW